jgi:hypothetical protein
MTTHGTSAAIVCLLVASVSAQGSPVDVGVRAREAAHIVVATVVDVTARFDTNASGDRLIYSDVLVEVSETLKGVPTNVLTLTLEGGQIGTLALRVSDLPVLRQGERVMCFLDRSTRGEWVPHRRGLGILKMDASGRIEQSELTLAQAKALVQSALR